MKSLMRLSLVLVLSMMITGVFAQQRGQGMRNMDPEAQAKQQLEQMKGIIKIEKKEEAKLLEVLKKSAKERTDEMAKMRDSGNREGMREKMAEMNKKRDAELEKILGEKRMKKYLEELEKIRQERGGQRRGF